jgi:hypothetical protein
MSTSAKEHIEVLRQGLGDLTEQIRKSQEIVVESRRLLKRMDEMVTTAEYQRPSVLRNRAS